MNTLQKDMMIAVAKCVALNAWHWKCNALLFEIQEKLPFVALCLMNIFALLKPTEQEQVLEQTPPLHLHFNI